MAAVSFFQNQSFQELKKRYHSGNLFRDDKFPANANSLGPNVVIQCIWRRPGEISRDPQFIVKGATRFDVNQGAIGNCWFIAALAAVAQHEDLFDCVVPRDQGFGADYSGMFHFRFWRDNQWHDVVVDDLLPCSLDGRLVFVRNGPDPNEFWCALIEKAFAKFHGSYEKLDGGVAEDALKELTAGTAESFYLKEKSPEDIWQLMDDANRKGGVMTASIFAEGKRITAPYLVRETRLANGLLRQHAYTITLVTNIKTMYGSERLIRIRNPWGNDVEWNGDWSDRSPKWNDVSAETRAKFQVKEAADGEFWMNFKDFASNFHYLTNCFPPVKHVPGGDGGDGRRKGRGRRRRKQPGQDIPEWDPSKYPTYPEWDPSKYPGVPDLPSQNYPDYPIWNGPQGGMINFAGAAGFGVGPGYGAAAGFNQQRAAWQPRGHAGHHGHGGQNPGYFQ